MGAQLRLNLTSYAPQCVHIWARDRGSPRKWQNHAKSLICGLPATPTFWVWFLTSKNARHVTMAQPQVHRYLLGIQGTKNANFAWAYLLFRGEEVEAFWGSLTVESRILGISVSILTIKCKINLWSNCNVLYYITFTKIFVLWLVELQSLF